LAAQIAARAPGKRLLRLAKGLTRLQGDLNGDGLVDVADYDIWAANVGNTASTPEPATLSLVAFGGLALLRRKNG
jgi:hypothetical protein